MRVLMAVVVYVPVFFAMCLATVHLVYMHFTVLHRALVRLGAGVKGHGERSRKDDGYAEAQDGLSAGD